MKGRLLEACSGNERRVPHTIVRRTTFMLQEQAAGRIDFCINLRREEMDHGQCNIVGCGFYCLSDSIHVFNIPCNQPFSVNLGLDLSKTAEGLFSTMSNMTGKIQKDQSNGARGSDVNYDQFPRNWRRENCWCY